MSQAPEPAKATKKMSGCMLAVIIVGALALLAAIAVVTMVVLAFRTPEGAAALDLLKTSVAAQQGPGTDALRTYGCKRVSVLPVAALNDIAARADAGPVIPEVADLWVTCAEPPADRTCDAMAAAFISAAKTTGPIRFAIADGENERCGGYYDATGRPMAETPAPR